LGVPIGTVALIRMVSAFGSTACMVQQKTFMDFKGRDGWLFTLGLTSSAVADILITVSIWVLLRRGRNGVKRTEYILDTLIRDCLENGALTSAGTIVSLVCWVSMNNLIFLGTHFVISKLYSNSLMASLHARRRFRNMQDNAVQEIALFPGQGRNTHSSHSADRQPIATRPEYTGRVSTIQIATRDPVSSKTPDSDSDFTKNVDDHEWNLPSPPNQVKINVHVQQHVV